MSHDKKYALRLAESEQGWSAQITRRISARKTSVTKKQDGFATEAEAKVWGDKALQEILDNLMVRNERRAKQRVERDQVLADKEAATKKWREGRKNRSSDDDYNFDDDYDFDDDGFSGDDGDGD